MAESAILCQYCSGQQSDEALELEDESLDEPLPSKRPRPLGCSLCSGIHSVGYLRSLVTQIKSKIEQEPYNVTSFSLALKFPAAILVRQHALGLFLGNAVCLKGLFRARLSSLLSAALGMDHSSESKFCINLEFVTEVRKKGQKEDAFFLTLLHSSTFKAARRQPAVLTQGAIMKVLDQVTQQDYMDHAYWPPPTLDTPMTMSSLQLSHEPVYVGGRYTKHSRTLSQTPWVIEGQRKTSTSVQELLATPLLAAYKAAESKFSSAGREDADVRMLGEGRPFLLELVNPHNPCIPCEEMARIADSINSCHQDQVGVRDLCAGERFWCERLKQGEEDKKKTYCALVRCCSEVLPEAVAGLARHKDLLLRQKTPVRVLHRRSLATRERTVYWMQGEGVDTHHFKLRLCTQAGTYIKEFVHGDLGRTTPNLASLLGQPADIVALDVEEVEMVWPPQAPHCQ